MQKLIFGEAIEEMKKIAVGSIDLILTDPPYNIARDNNFHTMGRTGIDFGEWDKDFDLFSWIDSAIPLLSKNASMIIFNDWKNLGNIARYAESKGMVIKDMLRWKKLNPMPRNMNRRYITDFEVAVWLTLPKAKWIFNKLDENKYQRPLFEGSLTPPSEKVGHTTQKPEYLIFDLIKIHSNENDTILDPFVGSGTTIVSCKKLHRNGIGIDNGRCEKDKEINGVQLKGLRWTDISKMRLDGKI